MNGKLFNRLKRCLIDKDYDTALVIVTDNISKVKPYEWDFFFENYRLYTKTIEKEKDKHSSILNATANLKFEKYSTAKRIAIYKDAVNQIINK